MPPELSPDDDPPIYDLLPIPERELTEAEKRTVLSAFNDAHNRGGKRILAVGSVPETW